MTKNKTESLTPILDEEKRTGDTHPTEWWSQKYHGKSWKELSHDETRVFYTQRNAEVDSVRQLAWDARLPEELKVDISMLNYLCKSIDDQTKHYYEILQRVPESARVYVNEIEHW
jgi:hypothetical protein